MKAIKTSLLAVSLISLAACQSVPPPSSPVVPLRMGYSDRLAVQPATTRESQFNSKMIFLADQLEKNLDAKKISATYVLTTFVDLDKMSNHHAVGRLMSEQLMHELQVRRWNVVEMRLGKDISINENGEFALTRNTKRLKNEHELTGVITGTYSIVGNDIFVNVRVIDYQTGAVASSAQTHFRNNSIVGNLIEKDQKSFGTKISVVADR